jgi:flagellar biosynthesis component FlhA
MPRSGGDLMLAGILAILSYAPFEYVAKATLVMAAFLFILDPIPPYSRFIALISMGVVGLLSRTLRAWEKAQKEEQAALENEVTVTEADKLDTPQDTSPEKSKEE